MADLGRILRSTVMAAIFAAPAYAQECGRLFPNIDAAYQEALTGNLADAEQVLRVLSSGSNPEELMKIASVARRGLPAVGPLRKPNPQLAMLALEQAIRIDGAHRPRALFLLAELGRETGQMTPERQDELIRLGGLLGNDKALIEIAREIMDSNQTVGPASGSNMLSVLIDGGLRLRSPEIAELAVEILDRGDIPLNLIPTREQLVATVIDILTDEFQGGRVGAATDLANLYLEDKLVPVDLEQATYWAEQTEGCREAREWRLMAEIAFLTEPDRSVLVAEYYRRAAELGDVGGALELARLRTRGVSSEVSEDEALLWLERAIKIGSLAAMLERTRGGIERALPPYDSPVMEAAVTQAARDWNGDARDARILGQLYDLAGTNWFSPDAAEEWFRIAAMAYDPVGMVEYAKMLRPTDPAQAQEWLRRAIAAGSTSALVEMADFLLTPPFTSDRVERAVGYLERAVSKGSISGMSALASLYLDDTGPSFQPEKGEELLRQAARLGGASAQARLARLLLDRAATGPANAAQLRDQAGRLLAQAAQAGNLTAKHMIAELIFAETEDPEQVARAVQFLREAADGGRASAMIDLASYYITVGELESAVEVYRRAAALNNIRAMMELARAYSAGLGVPEDDEIALQWLARAEALGEQDARTLRQLAEGYIDGTFGLPDIQRGIAFYEQAASTGDPASMMRLATLYFDGFFVPQDLSRAYEWALQAAELDNVSAMVFVGEALAEGHGVDIDNDESLRWMQKAIETNPNSATASLAIGRAYELGLGFPVDRTKALAYYTRAAELGNRSAMVRVARAHLRGIGTDQRPDIAVQWYDKAAREKSMTAILEIAQLHGMGYGTPLDQELAYQYFNEAAQLGSTVGMREAARLLVAGLGVPRDAAVGIGWLERAASLGETGAMRDLSILYGEGYEVPQDSERSLYWLRQAKEGGHHQASYEYLAMTIADRTNPTDDEIEILKYAVEGKVKEATEWLIELGIEVHETTDEEAGEGTNGH